MKDVHNRIADARQALFAMHPCAATAAAVLLVAATHRALPAASKAPQR